MAAHRAVRLEALAPAELRVLLERERQDWLRRLDWDPGNAAEVTAQAVECGLLQGAALVDGRRALAHVAVQPSPSLARLCSAHVPAGLAAADVAALVDEAIADVREDMRVEGQIVAFEAQPGLDAAFDSAGFVVEERRYLSKPLAPRREAAEAPDRRIRPFDRRDLPDCARVLVEAHEGGVEARINEAFRTTSAALGYLVEVGGGPSCPALVREASWVSVDGGRVTGFSFGTRISPGVGHVPQIAVAPGSWGEGVGGRLLERSLAGLAAGGDLKVTLSVSVANTRAREWYERHGFAAVTTFSSYHRDPPGRR